MSKINKFLLAALAVILFLFVMNTVKKPDVKIPEKTPDKVISEGDGVSKTIENEGGNVTVIAKPKVLKIGRRPAFEVEFETHSVDLSFDVAKQSRLVDNKGKDVGIASWDGSPPGGHHRNGTLSFNGLLAETKSVELLITDVAGIAERKFKWNLQL